MFLHLPIVTMAVLSPVAVSDTVPAFDIVRECRFESESTPEAFDRCSSEEIDAREKLQKEWPKYVAEDKRICNVETAVGGFVSYVELLTCLELANDLRKENVTQQTPLAKEEPNPAGQDLLETPSGDGHSPNGILKTKSD